MLDKRQQRLPESEIKNDRVNFKGFRVISELPQASGFKQFATHEIIQLMMLLDDGESGFRFHAPWCFAVELVERLINILHVNVRDVGSRALVLDSEDCEIVPKLSQAIN